jgi:hypothetical protein
MTPPSSDLLEQAKWLVNNFPADTPMVTMVHTTGWRGSHITMLLRLQALSPEIHSLVHKGVLSEKQIKRLTNVVRADHRERILREMLCES